MSLYKRGGVWYYKFKFQGAVIRESTGLTNKQDAREKEDERHTDLRKGRAHIQPPSQVPLFSIASDKYLKAKRRDWAPKTLVIETTNFGHLIPVFGKRLLSDITHTDVSDYMDGRKAAAKTVSLEIGTLRGILLHHDLGQNWRSIRNKIKLKKARNIGCALILRRGSGTTEGMSR